MPGAARDGLPGGARADQAQRAALEPERLPEFLLLPLARAQGLGGIRHAPVARDQQPDGQFRDGIGIFPGQLAT